MDESKFAVVVDDTLGAISRNQTFTVTSDGFSAEFIFRPDYLIYPWLRVAIFNGKKREAEFKSLAYAMRDWFELTRYITDRNKNHVDREFDTKVSEVQ